MNLRADFREAAQVPLEGFLEFAACMDKVNRMTQALAQDIDFLDVMAQDGLLMQANRIDGERVRDIRVAVAVAADPGAELQQRRDFPGVFRIDRLQRMFEFAVQFWRHFKEAVLNDLQPLTHLVENRRAHIADNVGQPECLDLLGDDCRRGLPFLRQQGAILDGVELARDRREFFLQP